MKFKEHKIDEAILAVLYLTLHDGNRVWKTLEFDAMDRLFTQGFISNPAVRAKSVTLTEEGIAKAKAAAGKLFLG